MLRLKRRRRNRLARYFVLLRQQVDTIQGVLEVKGSDLYEEAVHCAVRLKYETIVRVQGRIRKAPDRIETCSIHDLEFVISSIQVLVSIRESPDRCLGSAFFPLYPYSLEL